MNFETYVKYGKNWTYQGLRRAQSGKDAAFMTGYTFGRRVIAVRPEDSRDKIQVYRYKTVPKLKQVG